MNAQKKSTRRASAAKTSQAQTTSPSKTKATKRKTKTVATKAKAKAKAGRREAKTAIRREQIMSAALALFSEHGYSATSTARIAKAAGVAEGLVFHYFPNKEALLIEIAARHHTFAGRVLLLLQQDGDRTARELLFAIAEGLADVSAEERAFIGFMQAESQINTSLRSRVVTATKVVLEAIVRVLARRVQTGELRADTSLKVAVQGFFGGFMFFYGQHRDLDAASWRREASAFGREWAEQCWRGIATSAILSEHSKKSIQS